MHDCLISCHECINGFFATNARMIFGCHEGRNGFFAKNARMIFVFIRVFVANFFATNANKVFIHVFVATIFATNAIRILFVYSWQLISIRSIKKE